MVLPTTKIELEHKQNVNDDGPDAFDAFDDNKSDPGDCPAAKLLKQIKNDLKKMKTTCFYLESALEKSAAGLRNKCLSTI